jgi:hypothetical protein
MGEIARKGFDTLYQGPVNAALPGNGTLWRPNRFTHRTTSCGETAWEVAMPLIYLPLIMYASLMEFMAQPFRAAMVPIDRKARTDVRRDARHR